MAKNLHISYLLDFYSGLLTEKQREVMNYYYNDDLSLGEIAANEGITRQGVRDSIKRAETQLLELESQLGLVRRFRGCADSGIQQPVHLFQRNPEGCQYDTPNGAAAV